MSSRSLTGFRGAPLTKGLFWTTVASSLAADVLAKRARGRPSLAGALLRGLQFQGPSALFIGASMLYCFRVLERLEGPARSAGARLAACGAAWVAQSALCRVLGLAPVPGPYLLVFSDLVSYWQAVPSLQDFAVGGVQLNDKLFVYAGCAQLALLAGQPGLVAAAAGLLGGALWNANAANVQNWKVPAWLHGAVTGALAKLDGLSAPGRRFFVARHEGTQAGPVVRPSPVQRPRRPARAAAEALEALKAMGFEEARAREALERADNSVERALTYLL